VASRFRFFAERMGEGLNVVLDVGCRLGWAGHLFSAIVGRPLKVVGLDVYEPYLEKLAAISKLYELIKIDLEKDRIPLPDSSVDLAFAIEVIEHLSKPSGYYLIREMERVVKNGGFIYITTPNGFKPTHGRASHLEHKSGWTENELKKLGMNVRGYGFPVKYRIKKLERFFSNIDFAWTSISRIFPSLGYGLEAWKRVIK